MSLDYALPKKFPHKLALIDVQFFLENVSTHYLRHVLFVWRLLTWKKKKEIEVSKELAEWWKQQRFVHLANSQQYFSVEGHAGDLQSRVNSWWLLVPQFLPCSPGACMCCRLHASQWRCPPASETVPCSQKSRISQRGCMTSTDPRLWAKCWTRKCKKKKVSTFTVCYASTCVCTCDVCTPASIYIDQRKARFHKNKVRIWILFFFF